MDGMSDADRHVTPEPMVQRPELIVRITKRTDGGAILECVRADGSRTWQVQHGGHAAFFPLHDLTHYALECEQGVHRAFYGLIADGWDIDDTTGKGTRGPLPPEALHIEHLVGLFDIERVGGAAWAAEDLNVQASLYAAHRGLPAPRPISDVTLERVRMRLEDLLAEWHALPPGESIARPFNRQSFLPAR